MESSQDPQTTIGRINRGIAAHNDKDNDRARRYFADALLEEPGNELAWLWMAEASANPEQRLYCLNRAVSVNPDSKGRSTRDRLRERGVKPETPVEISDLNSPPPPLRYRSSGNAGSLRIPVARRFFNRRVKPTPAPSEFETTTVASGKRRWPLWLAGGVVLLAMMSVFIFANRNDGDVVYIALAGPMSGANADIGQEMKNGANIAVDTFNRDHDGPDIAIKVFDDQNNPNLAVEIARQIVEDDSIVAVVGHGSTASSLAAAPIYAEAGIPAISGQATSNELANYPDYFRTIFSDRSEAVLLSKYVRDVFEHDTVTIVTGDGAYEQSLSTQFAEAIEADGATVAATQTITADDRDGSVDSIVQEFTKAAPEGMVVLILTEDNGHSFVLKMRRAGVNVPIVASESMGSTRFAALFADEPEELNEPGYFTNGVYAASPLIYDAVGADSVLFSNNYAAEHGDLPSWRPARVWDAVTAAATAYERFRDTYDSDDIATTRTGISTALHAMDSPETAFRGLTGPIFFTEKGDAPQGLSMGEFIDGRLVSTSRQYRLVTNTTQYDIEEEVASGRAVEIDGYYVREYRVVFVGVEMVELRDLNTASQAFEADFFIWFRYDGDDAPVNILFTNASNAGLSLGEPLNESVTNDGMNYRLYRVQGTFNEPMDFSDYPWDRHNLTVRFQNPTLKQTDLVFVADPASVSLSQSERMVSALDQSRSFNNVPSWNVGSILYTQSSITSSSDDYDTEGLVQYSEFRIMMDTGRDVESFLGKNLLPLGLLTLVTYIAIWFPAEQAGARIGFAITAMLSSSVMLGSISNALPDIGYTVAIEWGYYAYIGLSALLVLLTIAVDRSFKAKRMARVRVLDTSIRIGYPIAIACVAMIYWMRFG